MKRWLGIYAVLIMTVVMVLVMIYLVFASAMLLTNGQWGWGLLFAGSVLAILTTLLHFGVWHD